MQHGSVASSKRLSTLYAICGVLGSIGLVYAVHKRVRAPVRCSRKKRFGRFVMKGLPNELLDQILSLLDAKDLVYLSLTCRFFAEFCQKDKFWKSILRREDCGVSSDLFSKCWKQDAFPQSDFRFDKGLKNLYRELQEKAELNSSVVIQLKLPFMENVFEFSNPVSFSVDGSKPFFNMSLTRMILSLISTLFFSTRSPYRQNDAGSSDRSVTASIYEFCSSVSSIGFYVFLMEWNFLRSIKKRKIRGVFSFTIFSNYIAQPASLLDFLALTLDLRLFLLSTPPQNLKISKMIPSVYFEFIIHGVSNALVSPQRGLAFGLGIETNSSLAPKFSYIDGIGILWENSVLIHMENSDSLIGKTCGLGFTRPSCEFFVIIEQNTHFSFSLQDLLAISSEANEDYIQELENLFLFIQCSMLDASYSVNLGQAPFAHSSLIR